MAHYEVLLIEEDLSLGQLVTDALNPTVFNTRITGHVKEALEILRTERIDLLVSDHKDISRDGFQLFEYARTVNPRIAIVILPLGAVSKSFMNQIAKVLLYKAVIESQTEIFNEFLEKGRAREDWPVLRECLKEFEKDDELLKKIRTRSLMKKLENEYPGITEVTHDPKGFLILESRKKNSAHLV